MNDTDRSYLDSLFEAVRDGVTVAVARKWAESALERGVLSPKHVTGRTARRLILKTDLPHLRVLLADARRAGCKLSVERITRALDSVDRSA